MADYLLPNAVVGTPYSYTVSPLDNTPGGYWAVSGASTPYPFGGLTFYRDGTITGTPTTHGGYAFTLIWNATSTTSTRTLQITIQEPPLFMSGPSGSATGTLRDTPQVSPGVGWKPTITGGYLPYQSISYSGLPPGVSWDPNQGYVLTGRPTQTGSFTALCTVVDQIGQTASVGIAITVNPATPMVLANTHPPALGFRIPYSFQLSVASGLRGNPSLTHYTVQSGTLPAGLTLSYQGLLSGSAIQSGTFNIGIAITDTDAWTDTGNTLVLVVAAAPGIVLTSANPPTAFEELAYTFSFTATGGTGNGTYYYAPDPVTMPAGLTVSNAGVLSGTPTLAGYYRLTVYVSDSNGVTAAQFVPFSVFLAYRKRDPYHNIFYQILNADGTAAYTDDGQLWTNDPNPNYGGKFAFAQAVVGYSIGVNQFQITDARERGGGLAPEAQGRSEAQHFWDLGYWDGKPEPLGGALIIRLPQSKLATLPKALLAAKIRELLPAGVMPVLRFYDEETGEESL